jgi:hypothetical protein
MCVQEDVLGFDAFFDVVLVALLSAEFPDEEDERAARPEVQYGAVKRERQYEYVHCTGEAKLAWAEELAVARVK